MRQKTNKFTLLLIFVLILVTLGACGKKGNDSRLENASVDVDVSIMEDEDTYYYSDEIIAFKELYMNSGENEYKVSHEGNFMIGNSELSDPLFINENISDEWMGYSEVELGFLAPEEMPNCFDSTSETGMIIPAIKYENEYYFYVNEYKKDLEIIVGKYGSNELRQVLMEYKKYSDVWVSSAIYVEDIKVLGGLEEYGKYCAQKGDK